MHACITFIEDKISEDVCIFLLLKWVFNQSWTSIFTVDDFADHNPSIANVKGSSLTSIIQVPLIG